MKLMHWIYTREHAEPEQGCMKKDHHVHISRAKTRNRPNWVSSYHKNDKLLNIWVMGTRNKWDWTNLLNVCHKEIILQYPTRRNIFVHKGVYDAINSISFYAPLFADIYTHFHDAADQPIDRLIFSGHS